MSNSRSTISKSKINCAIGAAIFAASIPIALAQEVTFTGDQATLAATGGYGGSTPAIGADGVIATIDSGLAASLPAANDAGFPNTSFTLSASGVTDGAYKFRAGIVVISQNGNSTRLEISIPEFTMTFASNSATITFPAGNATVLGRDSTGSLEASGTIPNSVFSSSGANNLTLNFVTQISNLNSSGTSLFTEIIDRIVNEAEPDYQFKVFLRQIKQSAGEQTIQFGTTGFTALRCAPASASDFILNSSQFASDFGGSYALQGAIAFGGGAYGGAAPTAFSAANSCDAEPFVASGGGGGSTTSSTTAASVEEAQTLSDADLSEPTAETIALVETAVEDAAEVGNNISDDLLAGNATVSQGVDAVNTIVNAIEVSGELNSQGDTAQETGDLVNITQSAGNVIAALTNASTPITATDVANVESTVEALTTSLAENVADDLSSAEAVNLANSLATVMDATIAIGGSISPSLKAAVQSVANNLVDASAREILERFNVTDVATAVRDVPRVSVTVFFQGVTMAEFDRNKANFLDSFNTALGSRDGLSSSSLQRALDTSSPLADFISDAIGSGTVVAVDDDSGLIEITSGGGRYATIPLQLKIVPDVMPEGVTLLPDGSASVVTDGFGQLTAPASRNIDAFTSTLNSDFGATVAVNSATGSYLLETSDLRASVSFAFESFATSAAAAVGSATLIEPPTANPADPAFNYSVSYGDGSTQSLAPFVAEEDFLDALAETGVLDASIDRSTGVIDMGDGLFLKPDYVITDLTDFQMQLVENDGGSLGVVIGSAGDVNGDGLADTIVLSDKGAQILFAVP